MNYYKKNEELPSISFSPDADFPCIYAEKGILSPYFCMDYSKYTNLPIVLEHIDCDNNPLNVVPKISSCVLKIDDKKNYHQFYNKLITITFF